MPRGHWLDPLARAVLRASGQLPQEQPAAAAASSDHSTADAECATAERIEQDLLDLKLRQNPGRRLSSAQEVRHAAALGWRLDVNRATAADWLRLPGIEAAQVDLLLRLQRGGVQLSGPDDLQRLLDIPASLVACWQPLLLFRWYGDGAPAAVGERGVDINRAPAQELERRLPQLSPERRQRLLRERQRARFANLADLQERLQLPAAVVEDLIGRVRFGHGPAGPDLPRSA